MAKGVVGVPYYNPVIPMSTYIKFKLGNMVLEGKTPNFISGFTFIKHETTQGEFELTLSDVMDYNLEAKILEVVGELKSNISFQYGHANGSRSQWFRGMITEYTPQFRANLAATFVLKGITDMALGKKLNKKYKLKDYGYRYSNLIRALAQNEGWKIGEPFIQSDKVTAEDITAYNMTTIEFIRNKLIPLTKKDKKPTKFLHFCHSDGVKVILDSFDISKPKIIKKEFNFSINSGNYGKVLSFIPSYSGIVASSLKVNAGYVDRVTNQFNVFKNNPKLNVPTKTQFLGGTSPEAFSSVLQSQWINENVGFSTATMEVVGDPDLVPMDYINVLPMRPDGKLHHTAGTYFIKDVSESISGGGYRTSMGLIKIAGKTSDIVTAYESGWK